MYSTVGAFPYVKDALKPRADRTFFCEVSMLIVFSGLCCFFLNFKCSVKDNFQITSYHPRHERHIFKKKKKHCGKNLSGVFICWQTIMNCKLTVPTFVLALNKGTVKLKWKWVAWKLGWGFGRGWGGGGLGVAFPIKPIQWSEENNRVDTAAQFRWPVRALCWRGVHISFLFLGRLSCLKWL